MSLLSDTALLERIRQDDVQAFKILYDRFWESLFLFAMKRLKNEADAKDVVQEMLIRLWVRRHTLNIETTLGAYLASAAHYEVLRAISGAIKDAQRRENIATRILPGFASLLDPVQLKELESLLEREVDKLPLRMQQVYRLSREEELSIPEIAARLGVAERTVRNQLNTALHKLHYGLKEAYILSILLC
ncbi:RNA polymerase sigma factor [Chitinophaga nivalis]|uniref:Sigma-70 family RNA polymerase sigma factor n=1 Tax=Chitinophaga nivalis TaxID=2991709 RepID=A0ABT3IF74_9BACT|nr:sigma-70 family RNA polymerase sigma factor [Chitinophaga nivalis]MCW3467853.1 sigma-70 family RNA polymerase sigma factor [Chitinophaga nivalis]MCW3482455.1 sigma-70 family RNA polymerase sigma factor [Chitinophaga nivalis]